MDTKTTKKQQSGCGWIMIPFGIWILVSPFVLGYDSETAGMASNVISGGLLVLVGFLSGWVSGNWVSLSVPIAAWLFISAFVLELWGLTLLWSNVLMTVAIMMSAGISEGIRLPRLAEVPPETTTH